MAVHLINHLPIDNKIVRYAKYFQPSLQQHDFTPKALSQLALMIGKTLGKDAMKEYFGLKMEQNENDLCDVVKKEATEYQTEVLPQISSNKDQPASSRVQPSYWKYAYGLIGIEPLPPEQTSLPIDEFWEKVLFLCHVNKMNKYLPKTIN